jgi:Mor family transcriptional regulator
VAETDGYPHLWMRHRPVAFFPVWDSNRSQEREDDIWLRRQRGETFASIGRVWDISTERVRQIYKKRYSDENYKMTHG